MLELKARSTKKKKDLKCPASTLGARQGFLSLALGFSCECNLKVQGTEWETPVLSFLSEHEASYPGFVSGSV